MLGGRLVRAGGGCDKGVEGTGTSSRGARGGKPVLRSSVISNKLFLPTGGIPGRKETAGPPAARVGTE